MNWVHSDAAQARFAQCLVALARSQRPRSETGIEPWRGSPLEFLGMTTEEFANWGAYDVFSDRWLRVQKMACDPGQFVDGPQFQYRSGTPEYRAWLIRPRPFKDR